MESSKNKILKWNFVYQYGYVLTNIFNSIILLPLYVKHIDSTSLGLWFATGNILAWLTMADPGIGDIMQQKIAELLGKKELTEIRKTIGSGMFATVIIMALCVVVGVVFYVFLDDILGRDLSGYNSLRVAFVFSILATGLSLVCFGMSGINQGLHNSFHVAMSSLLSNVLFLVVNVALLYFGYGIISIAIANLARAFFLCLYNVIALLSYQRKNALTAIFEFTHFKAFIKLFSYTSISKIVIGLTNNIDLIILARYIPASLITNFEINRRPIKILQSLMGRHSVALMPLISYQKGQGEHAAIEALIIKQFKYFTLVLIFCSFQLLINYSNLISFWVGSGKYAGNTVIYLLVGSFFIATTGFFMSNIGYALGDIKMNSLLNTARGIVVGVVSVFVAKNYGIIGVLATGLFMEFTADFLFFTYRLIKLGFITLTNLRNVVMMWLLVIPLAFIVALGVNQINNVAWFQVIGGLYQLIIRTALFTVIFAAVVLAVDSNLRLLLKSYFQKGTRKLAL